MVMMLLLWSVRVPPLAVPLQCHLNAWAGPCKVPGKGYACMQQLSDWHCCIWQVVYMSPVACCMLHVACCMSHVACMLLACSLACRPGSCSPRSVSHPHVTAGGALADRLYVDAAGGRAGAAAAAAGRAGAAAGSGWWTSCTGAGFDNPIACCRPVCSHAPDQHRLVRGHVALHKVAVGQLRGMLCRHCSEASWW